MTLEQVWGELISAAQNAGVEVRLEPMRSRSVRHGGGLVTLRGRLTVLIDEAGSPPERLAALSRALLAAGKLDLSRLSPVARATLGRFGAAGVGPETPLRPLARARPARARKGPKAEPDGAVPEPAKKPVGES